MNHLKEEINWTLRAVQFTHCTTTFAAAQSLLKPIWTSIWRHICSFHVFHRLKSGPLSTEITSTTTARITRAGIGSLFRLFLCLRRGHKISQEFQFDNIARANRIRHRFSLYSRNWSKLIKFKGLTTCDLYRKDGAKSLLELQQSHYIVRLYSAQ